MGAPRNCDDNNPCTDDTCDEVNDQPVHTANDANCDDGAWCNGAETCDLVVALGSTLSVHPAASFPLAAAEAGAPYVIVNRGETEHDTHPAVTLRLEGDVVEIFPAAVEAALG